MPLDYGATQAISSFNSNAVLIWMKEDGSEVRFPIFAAVTTIGREASNMIPINDGSISRHHAKLMFQNGEYILTDLGSANKTYVNGQEIRETVLQSGCEIRFAGQRFIFQVLQASAPAFVPAPPVGPPPMPMGSTPMAPPYSAPPSYRATPAPRKKPKPIIILGGVFAVLVIVIVVVLKIAESPSSQPPTEKVTETPQATPTATPSASTSAPTPVVPPPSAPAVSPTPTTTSSSAANPGASPSPVPPVTTSPTPTGPQDIGRLMDEALSLESSGKLRDARLRYEQVLRIDPTNARARTHLEDVKRTINDAINLHFKNAKQAYDFLRFDEAISEWNLVLSLADPSDTRYMESQKGIQQAQARLKR